MLSKKWAVGSLVAVLATGVAGCSSNETPPAASPSGSQTSTAKASASVAPAASQDNGAADAGIDANNPPQPIGTATVQIPISEDPKAKITVDVLSLRRKDKLLVLTAALTPTNSSDGAQAMFTLLGNGFWSPSLIDSVNLKQYSPVRVSGGGELMTSVTSVRAVSGQPMYVYAVFAAPPQDVTHLAVIFNSSVPVITGVPLS